MQKIEMRKRTPKPADTRGRVFGPKDIRALQSALDMLVGERDLDLPSWDRSGAAPIERSQAVAKLVLHCAGPGEPHAGRIAMRVRKLLRERRSQSAQRRGLFCASK